MWPASMWPISMWPISMWMISPLSWLLIAIGIAACARLLERGRTWALRAAVALGALAVFAMTPLCANLLIARLERMETPSPDCLRAPPEVAVVLAGGVTEAAADSRDLDVLNLASRRRLDRAVDWQRAGSGRVLVLSGGVWYGHAVPDSALMRAYALQRGVPATLLREEARSRTTWESAQALATLRPSLPRRIALVTSAAHLPRAAYALRRAGFAVCPIAADRQALPLDRGALLPQRSALEKTERALHEFIGLLAYRLR